MDVTTVASALKELTILLGRQVTQIPGGQNECLKARAVAVERREGSSLCGWSGKASWRWHNVNRALKEMEVVIGIGGGEQVPQIGLLWGRHRAAGAK